MKTYLAIFTMLAIFLLEWILGAASAGKVIFLPLSALVFCFLIWRMEFEARMWFALTIGFIMDTIHLIPFGASLMACVVLALICEVFRTFFSNTESRVTQSIGVVLLALMFFAMVPWWGFVLGTFIS